MPAPATQAFAAPAGQAYAAAIAADARDSLDAQGGADVDGDFSDTFDD